jgi:hypothetical protein
MELETVTVYGENGPVIINKTDLPEFEKKGFTTNKPAVVKKQQEKSSKK